MIIKAYWMSVAALLIFSRACYGQDTEPWATFGKTADEDIDIYYEMRGPAAIPMQDTDVIAKVQEFIALRTSGGQNVGITITDTFGRTRVDSDGQTKEHHGWDLEAPKGTEIRWVDDKNDAMVQRCDAYAPWPKVPTKANYGYQLAVRTTRYGITYVLRFCHLLDWGCLHVLESKVRKNQLLAYIGTSGRMPDAPHPHLHLEVFREDGTSFTRIDPADFFKASPPPAPEIKSFSYHE